MTFAKGVTSGYLPLGGSIVSNEIAATLAGGGDFNHGYTYSGHPVSCAVALENIRILEEENLVSAAETGIGVYLRERWATLADHPLVGEARMRGMMGAIELTPDKAARAGFAAGEGAVGFLCRERSFANGLIMRHVRDSMILSPPLTISRTEVDTLVELAWKTLDQTHRDATAEGLMVAAR
jgi:putrescine aminotransferase